MSQPDTLTSNLLDLLHELHPLSIPLTLGGGFGLYFKRRWVQESGARTLLRVLPAIRPTIDLDIFLRAEVLADRARAAAIAAALRRLGYEAVEDARYMQFVQRAAGGGPVTAKVDLLVGPLGEQKRRMEVNRPRVRPRGPSIGLHAHLTEEALSLEEDPIAHEIAGRLSSGEAWAGTLHLPQAFPYLLMKLCAFADRKEDARKDLGRHHAMDLYTIVALTTELEYEAALARSARYADNPHRRRACEIVAGDFSGPESLGVLRLREHALFTDDMQIDPFLSVLAEIFPAG
ncbi:MAG TPA: hypothetical protein VFA26_23165 [Gemmataceae bacterium]|nr:hypothetical protein [Gemmataceae bacterium]